MKLKILSTTDGKYKGEVYEVDVIPPVGSMVNYKGTSFKVEGINAKGKYTTFYCANYSVSVEVLES
jgi:hypothetical protein